MKPHSEKIAMLAGSVLAASNATAAADSAVASVVARIKDPDEKVRAAAWQSAGTLGPAAVQPLAGLLDDADFEAVRAAKRALWKIVHQTGRPGAGNEKQELTRELLALLGSPSLAVRREALRMLSEIGDQSAVNSVARLLSERDLREDARAALERIPGHESLAALKTALENAADDFKPAIAHSLRVRGVKLADYPSQKLIPTRPATPLKSP